MQLPSGKLTCTDALAIFANRVSFSYPAILPDLPAELLFSNMSLHVDSGKTLSVMGASGSGKSTLCYLLAGLVPRHTEGTFEGSIWLLGHDVVSSPPLASIVGLLFQDAATQLFTTTAENEVAWGLEVLGVPSLEIGPRVMASLQLFGLLEHRHRPPWKLSGGQQKRLALAALWALRPRILLLDEPLGGVDPVGRVEVLEALELLRREGTTLLFTTPHLDDRWQDEQLSDTMVLLEGRSLSTPEPFSHLQKQEVRLIEAGLRCPGSTWDKFMRSHSSIDSEPAVEVRGLRYRYPDGPAVLHGIDLTIPRGQFVALVGSNGAGKTTLIRHFNGLLRPTSGTVRIMGEESSGQSVGELARKVGFLFQRPERQIFGTTVWEEIAYGPRHLQLSDVEERVSSALSHFGLTALAEFPPAVLSYGAQRSVTLAALSALETPVLVLDEPAVGLDGRGRAQLLSWLADRRAAGVTVIIATHEMPLANYTDRILVMKEGHIVEDRTPERHS